MNAKRTITSGSVVIAAPSSVVWELVGSIENMGRFSPETMKTEWLDGDSTEAEGARFRGTNHNGNFQWEVDCEILAHEREQRFQFGVGRNETGFDAIWTYELESLGTTTKLTEHVDAPVLLDPNSAPGKNPKRLQELAGLIDATLSYIKADAEALVE